MRPIFWRLAPLLLVFFAVPAHALIEKLEDRSAPVKPGFALWVDINRGSVVIETDDVPELRVRIRKAIKTLKEEEVAKLLEPHVFSLETKPDGSVKVHSHYKGEDGLHLSWQDWPPVEFVFEIRVPRQCSLKVTQRIGDLTVGDIKGPVEARLDSGEVYLKHIDGTLTAIAGNGSITLSACSGAATLKSPRGSVHAGPIGGFAVAEAGNGDVELQSAPAGCSANSVTADVKVSFPAQFKGDSKLSSSAGDIVATIDPDAKCTLSASSVWGHVTVKNLPFDSKAGEGLPKFSGTINGGGSTISMLANGGHVRIKGGKVAWSLEDVVAPTFKHPQ